MTGIEMIAECQVELGESQSTGAQQQAMLYPRHILRGANDVATDTFCLYKHSATDLINGQMVYPTPLRPFKSMAVNVKDEFGNVWPLESLTPEQADRRFPNWRSQNNLLYSGMPTFYIDEGPQNFKLLPVPNYNVLDGLIVSGYFGVDKWWDISTECPISFLGVNADEAVIAGGIVRRCREMKRLDPTYAAQLVDWEPVLQERLRKLYRQAGAAFDARTNIVPAHGSRYNSLAGGWGWYGG